MATDGYAIDASRIFTENPKLHSLRSLLRNKGGIVIGLSAGVDSSLLAKVAFDELGDKAVAVTAASPSLSSADRLLASGNAREIGIRHVFVETSEFENPEYRKNDAMRCYHCKAELSSALWAFARKEGLPAVALGVNSSDEGDFRPGIRAAAESGICFPLLECAIGKQEVREMAKALGLSAHDRPSNSCLSSRIQYGQVIDAKSLLMVEGAEEVLRDHGFRNVRVRLHGNVARIEVDSEFLSQLVEEKTRKEIAERFRSLGFAYVTLDLEGFRTGSMNLSLRNSL